VLIRTLFLLGAVAMLVSALIAGTQATANVVLHRKALAAMRAAYQTRVAAIESGLADSLEHGQAYAGPPAATSCVLEQGDGGCAIAVTATSHIDARSGGGELQENDAVDEGRIAASVEVAARASSGQVLGERRTRVVFRTLHAAPWALPSGELDAAFETSRNTEEPGDDGGMMPTPSAPGSLIDVVYRNARTGAEIPANVWHAATPGPDAAEAPWSP
jgi:hypothetical protein